MPLLVFRFLNSAIYFTDPFEAIGNPFEAIRSSCETIKTANEKIKFHLLDSDVYDKDYPHDWLNYYNIISYLTPKISNAATDLGAEAYKSKIHCGC